MLEVEGGAESCLRICATVGHALDNAFQLRLRQTRRRVFGTPATPYPIHTQAVADSSTRSRAVQSHPTRISETFAVWLDPSRGPRGRGWPAERKLEYVDGLMRRLRGTRPRIRTKREVDPLSRMRKTLGALYSKKREHYGLDHPDFYDSDLNNLFSSAPQYAKNPSAARFVRRIRKEARATIASFTDSYQYTIDRLLERVIDRCRELNLRLMDSEEATRTDFMVFLTVQTMNYLHSGRHRVAL